MGSIMVVHDGSYMPELDPLVCLAGYTIHCSTTTFRAKGTAAKVSDHADNYCGEIIEGIIVQLVHKQH